MESEYLRIRLTSEILSGFSVAGSLLVFSTYWFFKDNRSFQLELVQYYALSNLFYSASLFFPYNPNLENESPDFFCALQSFSISMFQNSSLIWSSIIGCCGFISIINKNHFESQKNLYRFFFFVITFLLPAAIASM